jgi:sugar O-acyltransferase (sialic acid O-acetyltransferase NeuD family)
MMKDLIIFGGGGFAREVAWLVADINRALPMDEIWNVVGFVEHSNERVGQLLNGIPIIGLDERRVNPPDAYAVAAIGATSIRENAVNQAKDLGFKFATLIHPDVRMDASSIDIGEGTIICAGNILTVNIAIGSHVIINLDCTIGHDSLIEDFVTISPGCHLSGYTTLRRGAYLGTGAVTVEKHEIGSRSVVGAGAVVVKDIPANVTAVGIPAKPIG